MKKANNSKPCELCGFVRILYSALLVSLLGTSGQGTFAQSPPHSGGWVVIGVKEYQALRTKAFPEQMEPERPPVDATLSRVEYDLHVNGELATGEATLTIDVLKEGWVRVGIPAGLFVSEARLDGKPVSLVASAPGKGAGQLSAVLSHPGRATLQLTMAAPVVSNAGEESLTLPPSSSGVMRATIELPTEGVDVLLSGGLLSDKTDPNAGRKWVAYARGNEPLTFAWRRKTEDHRATQALRMRSSLTELVGLGEEATSLNAEVNLEVTQGVATEVKLELPETVTVNQVLGAMVADWESKAGELHVTFLEPVEQRARFVITGEVKSPRDGMIAIPLLRLADSERETGGVAVEILGAGEIKEVQKEGLENADASDLGEMVASRQSPSLAAFRFRTGNTASNRSLHVNVARYTPQAVLMANVEEARYEVLATSEGKTLVRARYAVRNNQRNFLKITMPQGAVLWSAALAGTPIRPGQAPDGSVLLPLEKARSGDEAPAFAVELVYFSRGAAWSDRGQLKFTLPALDLPVSRTGLRLYHPPLFHVTAEPGTFRTETYAEPTSAVLMEGEGGGIGAGVGLGIYSQVGPPPPAAPAATPLAEQKTQTQEAGTQALVDQYRTKNLGSKVSGILPVRVSFPTFGPAIYLVSELTSENQSISAEISYQKEKKGGAR
jgi:hypothetical protein